MTEELTEEEENVLIGRYAKLRKRDSELYKKLEDFLKYDGKFRKAFEEKWPRGEDPDRLFKAKMSVNPNKIIKLTEEFRKLQEEYKKAHEELLEFESKYPKIKEEYKYFGY